ncbi:MAG: hypothetical protein M3327_05385 [Actinomycetota bacterium]|nr:hypothetical protein [Actinomycetota bacterium]
MRVALALVVLALSPLAGGCGTGEERAAPPTLPPNALPELSSERRSLDRASLAADAFAPNALSSLLDDSGYVQGVEREFFGRGEIFDHVVARGLRFETSEGAERYLGWVRSHARDLLGRAEAERRLELGSSGVLLALTPCGTCKKELPTYLAAWRRGDVVLSLLASGRGVDRERFAALARKLDARMEA